MLSADHDYFFKPTISPLKPEKSFRYGIDPIQNIKSSHKKQEKKIEKTKKTYRNQPISLSLTFFTTNRYDNFNPCLLYRYFEKTVFTAKNKIRK